MEQSVHPTKTHPGQDRRSDIQTPTDFARDAASWSVQETSVNETAINKHAIDVIGSVQHRAKEKYKNSESARATHPLARYISKEIQDLVRNSEQHIKNATHFIEKIKGIHLHSLTSVSFDVTSLLTKLPINEALEELHRRLAMAQHSGQISTTSQRSTERWQPFVPRCLLLVEDTYWNTEPTVEPHTDRHLNAGSHHHPAQNQAGVINERRLRTALSCNRYSSRDIERAIKRRPNPREKEEFLAITYLPYVKGCTDRIGRLLKKQNTEWAFTTMSNGEDPHLQGPGIYSIPCSCGKVYIGQTGRHVRTRLKEHKSDFNNNNFEKLTVAEQRPDTGHTELRKDAKT
ncbi:hypothetical protein NQ315_010519 [Exocentrus adspersus]|uniref:GIY-YIG domain-containing protein n=1 Tax=Exocentrus adspersus TaxID=1586481 RepID=A0AAV8W6V7_9CUCU|nr:hypothetical protein NQ315_010519 [Exocentrus adspersus]